MTAPHSHFAAHSVHQNFWDIDPHSLDERDQEGKGRLPILTPVSGAARGSFDNGRLVVAQAFSDACEAHGFKIPETEKIPLLRELGRNPERTSAIHAARLRGEFAHPGTQADAALQDAATLADTYASIQRHARTILARRSAGQLVNQLLMGGRSKHAVADSVAAWCREGVVGRNGRRRVVKVRGAVADGAAMADADLNAAGGLIENLTQYLYMAFLEPMAPLHFREVFRIQSGIGLGLLQLQILFYFMRGEARSWDGTGGDYGNSGPGVNQLLLKVCHFRSSDTVNMITEAREQLVFGAAGMRQRNLVRAHEVLHNRLAFGISRNAPPDLPIQGLATYPGLLVKSDGLNINTATAAAIFNAMSSAMDDPMIASNQAFDPDVLGITPTIAKKIKQPMVIGGVTVFGSIEGYWRNAYPGKDIRVMWELSGLLGTGVETMFAFPKNSDAAPYYLFNDVIQLPNWTNGYSVEMNAYSTSAGVLIASPVGAELYNFTTS